MSTTNYQKPEPKISFDDGVDFVDSRSMTIEEYYEREEKAKARSEYRDGRAVKMAGSTEDHGAIASNIVFALKGQLRGKNCRVLASDQRIRASDKRYYPDVVATCGDRVFDAFSVTTLLTPTVLVEVLSSSTEATDRGEKLENYCRIPSLRSYLLVSQYVPLVECYERGAGDDWTHKTYTDADDSVELPAIGCRLALSDIYDELDIWNAP